MIKKAIATVLLLIIVFLLPSLLVYLFPYTGLGRIIALPIIVLISINVVIGYYFLVSKNETYKKYPLFSALIALISILLINLVFYPQESRQTILTQTKNYIVTYNNYDGIVFEDIYIPRDNYLYIHQSDSLQRYIAALHKFQDQIPYDSTYSIYLEADRNIIYANEYDPILTSKEEIREKLKTGAEKLFYDILEFRY